MFERRFLYICAANFTLDSYYTPDDMRQTFTTPSRGRRIVEPPSIVSPGCLRRLLDVLRTFGLNPRHVERSPEGHVTLHADAENPEAPPDPLAKWEADRASPYH